MSLINCIDNASKEGIIPDDKKSLLKDLITEHTQKYLNLGDDPDAAALKGAKDAFESFEYKAANKKRHALLQRKVDNEAMEYMFSIYRDSKGNINPGEALKRIIGFMETPEGINKFLNVETRLRVVKGQLDKEWFDVLKEFRHTLVGSTRNKATMHDMGKEIYELGSSGNQNARELAETWFRVAEKARKMFNKAGGSIPKNKFWTVPTVHDQIKVNLVPKEKWVDDIIPLLDQNKMIDYTTGKVFGDKDLKTALKQVYDNIVSEGYLNKETRGFGPSRANTRLDHKFLYFKDYDSWLKYNDQFGTTDVFNSMLAHIDSMSRDIGLMQVMGPNPDNFMRKMRFESEKYANTQNAVPKDEAKRKTASSLNSADAMYLYIKGDLNVPVNPKMAKYGASFRSIATASFLGSAAFLAIGDFNLTRATASFAGMPQAKAMAENLKMFLSPLSGVDNNTRIKIAGTSGAAAEHWSTYASGAARMSADKVESHEFARRISDFILRTTQLSHMTQAGRWAAFTEFQAFTARNVDMSLKQMRKKNKRFADYLENYGITDADWDVIRNTKLFDAGEYDPKWQGALYLRPDDIVDAQIALKYNHAAQEFVNFAVPVANARGATIGGNVTKPGTPIGEIARGVLQFKQFPLTFMFTHIARGLGRKTIKGKMGYLLPLLITTTLFGAMSGVLKDVFKGKNVSVDDRWNDPRYWLDSMLHGGGLGFAGDMIFGGRYSHDSVGGRASEFIGPTAALGFEFLDLTAGNMVDFLSGKDVNLGADISSFIKGNTPGSSAWYMRLLLERYLFEYIQELTDDNYYQKNRRKINKTIRDEKNSYWWKPGDKTPNSLPSIFE